MEMDKDFDKLTVHELIADDSFLQWVKHPDEQLDGYWQSVMTAHPQARKPMEEARRMVREMHFVAHTPAPGRKEFMFDRIKEASGLKEQVERKEERPKIISIRRYLQIAAAIMVVAASGIWLYTRYGVKSTGGGAGTDTIIASTKEGVLFLSNGETINLGKLQVGTIVEKGGLRITMPEPKQLVFEENTTDETLNIDSLRTPVGQVWQLELADKSKVWLNSGSTIRLLADKGAVGTRGADISGEAYFDVVHRDNVPFVVRLNDVEVNVLGTEFDVVNYPGASKEVSLVKGRVQVKHKKGGVYQLKVGEKAAYDSNELEPDIIKFDLKQVTSWKDGVFSFHEMDMTTVLMQVGRWYGVKIVYDGTKPKAQISGTIPHESSLKEVLTILQDIGADARFEINADTLIVTSTTVSSTQTN
jgi:transmembrane sensor